MGKIRIVASMELGIQVGPGALSTKEECVVPRQPFRPQVPYEVGHALVMVVYLLSTKGNNCLVSYK